MKIVITGGTGFLGRHMVWRAAAAGCTVVFTGRNAVAANAVMQYARGRRNAFSENNIAERHEDCPCREITWQPLHHGDTRTQSRLNALSQGADVLIHCAALSAPWGKLSDFKRANITATAEVIAACKANRIPRLVHISTPSLYFDFRDRLNIGEYEPLPRPVNHYAYTKGIAEQLVRQSALPEVAVLRPRALFGPWDETLLPRLLRVIQNRPFPVMRGGNILLDLTYIDNAVDAVWRAATLPLPRTYNFYNVSNDEPRRLRDLLNSMAAAFHLPLRTLPVPWRVMEKMAQAQELAARLCGGKEPEMTRYSVGVLAFSQTLNVRALREELHWRATVPIDEGLRRHARWRAEVQG